MAEDKNIFDEASSQSKRPKKPRAKKTPKEPPPTDEEVEEMLTRINDLRRKIEKKLDEAYASQGLNYKTVNDYLDNSSNFSDQEWTILEERRKEVREEIEANLSLGVETKQKKKKGTKKRPRKMRGPRKDWLQMD